MFLCSIRFCIFVSGCSGVFLELMFCMFSQSACLVVVFAVFVCALGVLVTSIISLLSRMGFTVCPSAHVVHFSEESTVGADEVLPECCSVIMVMW